VKLGEFNTVKSQISAALRKAGGSLAVRDISSMVKPGSVVDSENLTTLFVVVGKYSVKDWEGCYEKLADFVVRRGGVGGGPQGCQGSLRAAVHALMQTCCATCHACTR
jgi:hypothetical protein